MLKKEFECQTVIFGPSSNVKIAFRMSKCDIWPKFECQNRNECQNEIDGPTSNVKIGIQRSNCDIRSEFKF